MRMNDEDMIEMMMIERKKGREGKVEIVGESTHKVSIFWLLRMASAKLKGAGMPGMKSKVVNSPGRPCMAKIIWWIFHCRRSCMFNSLNRFIMFGYAPKKMCSPVSIQSPSLSCQADTCGLGFRVLP